MWVSFLNGTVHVEMPAFPTTDRQFKPRYVAQWKPARLNKQPVPEIPYVEGLTDAKNQDDYRHRGDQQGKTGERPLEPADAFRKVTRGYRRGDEGMGSEHGDGKSNNQWEVNPEPLKEEVDVLPISAG